LFDDIKDAFAFQTALGKFRYEHPSLGSKINVDEPVLSVQLSARSTRVFYTHYISADNKESPEISLADIKHVLSSDRESVPYDPLKELQSLENISIFPGTKYYWCHLLSRKVTEHRKDENNCIWGSWIFHQYFDALNVEDIGVPLIAVKYISTSEVPEDLPVNGTYVTRRKVTVEVEFFNSETGKKAALSFQIVMKSGTEKIDELRFRSFLYPKDPVKFKSFLDEKYNETLSIWEEEENEE
jgi:hypothetical protein